MSRTPSLGTPVPVCQAGLLVPEQLPPLTFEQLLGPPEPAQSWRFELLVQELAVGEVPPAQESFQVISGTYDFAER